MEQTSSETSSITPQWGKSRYFPHVSGRDWNDWRWQFKNHITTIQELTRYLPIPSEEWELRKRVLQDFKMAITPYYLSLIDADDPNDPILREIIPLPEEYIYRNVGFEDPLDEENNSPVPGLTHRYPDRVLMVVSNVCSNYCRFCTRKRIMSEQTRSEAEIDRMIDYVARHPEVRDVIVSGGDPLLMPTARLERILGRIRAIRHVEIIRIGTRAPAVIPQRIDQKLCSMLAKFHPIWVNLHFEHPRECTPEAERACDMLSRAGIPLNNQSVLLTGVNDEPAVMKALVNKLLCMRVRPYYLYQCDPVHGTEHLRAPVSKGIEIIEALRGHTSGLAVPTLVIDAPGGGGKIPIGPQYMLSYDQNEGKTTLRNYKGEVFTYRDGHSMMFGGRIQTCDIYPPESGGTPRL